MSEPIDAGHAPRRSSVKPAISPPTASFTMQVGALGGGRADRGDARLAEQRLGLAVVDDVGDLVGGQVPVDRGDPRSRRAGWPTGSRGTRARLEHDQGHARRRPSAPAWRRRRTSRLALALTSANEPAGRRRDRSTAALSGCASAQTAMVMPLSEAASRPLGQVFPFEHRVHPVSSAYRFDTVS